MRIETIETIMMSAKREMRMLSVVFMVGESLVFDN